MEGWLNEASQEGSGDDITLGIICRSDMVQATTPASGDDAIHDPAVDVASAQVAGDDAVYDFVADPEGNNDLESAAEQTDDEQEQAEQPVAVVAAGDGDDTEAEQTDGRGNHKAS
jgi:hypothetical protein